VSQRSSRKRQRAGRSGSSASPAAVPDASPAAAAPDAAAASPAAAVPDAAPPATAPDASPAVAVPDASPAASSESARPPDAFERRYARSRAKDDAVRASLKPLAPGERPLAVTVGAVVAALLALANVIALIVGYESGDGIEVVIRTLVLTGLIVLVAVGMWKAKYWAVLGMHTLLALMIIFAALALVVAGNLWGAILMALIIVGSGTLFWFLVKAMARIQMPTPPSQRR
jgi:hypothetical protein